MFLSLKTLYRKRTVIWPFYFYTIIRTLSTEDKFKIIKNYDLKIKGFSNITIDLLEQNEKYISNQIATTQNINKITNIIKSNIKNEHNLDYLLSFDKISENIIKILMV